MSLLLLSFFKIKQLKKIKIRENLTVMSFFINSVFMRAKKINFLSSLGQKIHFGRICIKASFLGTILGLNGKISPFKV